MDVENYFSKYSGLYKAGPVNRRSRQTSNTKELEQTRRDKRRETVNAIRNIQDNDSDDATENIPPKALTKPELRKQRLLKWKKDKEEALKISKHNIKKPFVVGVVRHKINSPMLSEFKKPKAVVTTGKRTAIRETQSEPKKKTVFNKTESPNCKFSSNVKPSGVYKFNAIHGSSTKKLTLPMSPVFMKREAVKKLQLKNLMASEQKKTTKSSSSDEELATPLSPPTRVTRSQKKVQILRPPEEKKVKPRVAAINKKRVHTKTSTPVATATTCSPVASTAATCAPVATATTCAPVAAATTCSPVASTAATCSPVASTAATCAPVAAATTCSPVASTAATCAPVATATTCSPVAATTTTCAPVAAATTCSPVASTATSCTPVASTATSCTPVASTATTCSPVASTATSCTPVTTTAEIQSSNEKHSNEDEQNTPPNSYAVSPFVTVGRGNRSARRSIISKPSPRQKISLRDVPAPDEPADGPTFQKARVNSESSRLLLLADEWEKCTRLENITQDIVDDIDLVVGQTRLLTRDKFNQFRTLIEQHEADLANVKVTLDDLNGFWEMMFLQVESLDKKYERLDKLKSNNWVEAEEVAVKQRPTKTRAKKSVVAGNPSVRAFMKANKSNLEKTSLIKQVLTPVEKKRRSSVKQDSPAAYNALRLSFTAKDFGRSPLIQVTQDVTLTPKSCLKTKPDEENTKKSMRKTVLFVDEIENLDVNSISPAHVQSEIGSIQKTPRSRKRSQIDVEGFTPRRSARLSIKHSAVEPSS